MSIRPVTGSRIFPPCAQASLDKQMEDAASLHLRRVVRSPTAARSRSSAREADVPGPAKIMAGACAVIGTLVSSIFTAHHSHPIYFDIFHLLRYRLSPTAPRLLLVVPSPRHPSSFYLPPGFLPSPHPSPNVTASPTALRSSQLPAGAAYAEEAVVSGDLGITVLYGAAVVLLTAVTGSVAYLSYAQWQDNRVEAEEREKFNRAAMDREMRQALGQTKVPKSKKAKEAKKEGAGGGGFGA